MKEGFFVRNFKLAIFVLFLAVALSPAQAMANTWTGAANNNWGNSANWSGLPTDGGGFPIIPGTTNTWMGNPFSNIGTNVTIPAGTPFLPTTGFPGSNIGILTFSSTASWSLPAALTVTGVSVTNGHVTVVGTRTITVGLSGGQLTLSGPNITTTNAFTVATGATLANTLTWTASGAVTVNGVLNNTGTINGSGNLTVNSTAALPSVNNNNIAGIGNLIVSGTLNNNSSITRSGTINVSGTLTNIGSITATAGAITVSGILTNSGSILGPVGTVTVANGGAFTTSGTLVRATTVNSGGNMTVNAGTVSGATTINAGGLMTVNNTGLFPNGITGPLTVNGTVIFNNGFMSGATTVNAGGTMTVNNTHTPAGQGITSSLTINGTVTLNNGFISTGTTVVGNMPVGVSPTYLGRGRLIVNGGIFSQNISLGTAVASSEGRLEANGGNVTSLMINAGTVGTGRVILNGGNVGTTATMTLGSVVGGWGSLSFSPDIGEWPFDPDTTVATASTAETVTVLNLAIDNGLARVSNDGQLTVNTTMGLGVNPTRSGVFETRGSIGTVTLPTSLTITGQNGFMTFDHFDMPDTHILGVDANIGGFATPANRNIRIENISGRTMLTNATGGNGTSGATYVIGGELIFGMDALGNNDNSQGIITVNGETATLTWLSSTTDIFAPATIVPGAILSMNDQDISHRLRLGTAVLNVVDNKVTFGRLPGEIYGASTIVTVVSVPDSTPTWQHGQDNGGWLAFDVPFHERDVIPPHGFVQGIHGDWTIIGRLLNEYYLEILPGGRIFVNGDASQLHPQVANFITYGGGAIPNVTVDQLSTFNNMFFLEVMGKLEIGADGYLRNEHLLRNDTGVIYNDGDIINAGTLFSPNGIQGSRPFVTGGTPYTTAERPEVGERGEPGERGPRGRRGCNVGSFGLIALAGVVLFSRRKSA